MLDYESAIATHGKFNNLLISLQNLVETFTDKDLTGDFSPDRNDLLAALFNFFLF